MTDLKHIVRRGYANGEYADAFRRRSSLTDLERDLFRQFTEPLPDDARLLDLGCGTGLPYDRHLADLSYDVTGVDFVAKHLRAARRNVPEATFIEDDIQEVDLEQPTFDGILCLYTLFHLPRDNHPEMLEQFADHLLPGGHLLITLGTELGEHIEEDWCGAEMGWSSLAPETYRRLLRDNGFDIVCEKLEGTPDSDEHHLWVLARH